MTSHEKPSLRYRCFCSAYMDLVIAYLASSDSLGLLQETIDALAGSTGEGEGRHSDPGRR